MIWIVVVVVVSAAVVAGFKYLLACRALQGVEPADRVEVIDALGRMFRWWR